MIGGLRALTRTTDGLIPVEKGIRRQPSPLGGWCNPGEDDCFCSLIEVIFKFALQWWRVFSFGGAWFRLHDNVIDLWWNGIGFGYRQQFDGCSK